MWVRVCVYAAEISNRENRIIKFQRRFHHSHQQQQQNWHKFREIKWKFELFWKCKGKHCPQIVLFSLKKLRAEKKIEKFLFFGHFICSLFLGPRLLLMFKNHEQIKIEHFISSKLSGKESSENLTIKPESIFANRNRVNFAIKQRTRARSNSKTE